MALANITALVNFERLFDRAVPALFMGLGAVVAAALVTIGV